MGKYIDIARHICKIEIYLKYYLLLRISNRKFNLRQDNKTNQKIYILCIVYALFGITLSKPIATSQIATSIYIYLLKGLNYILKLDLEIRNHNHKIMGYVPAIFQMSSYNGMANYGEKIIENRIGYGEKKKIIHPCKPNKIAIKRRNRLLEWN